MERERLLFLKRHLAANTFPYITIIVITTQAELAHIGGLSSFIIIHHYLSLLICHYYLSLFIVITITVITTQTEIAHLVELL